MSYGKGAPTLRTIETNDNNADALIHERRWDGEFVTFGFTSDFRNDYEEESGYANSRKHLESFQAFSDLQQ